MRWKKALAQLLLAAMLAACAGCGDRTPPAADPKEDAAAPDRTEQTQIAQPEPDPAPAQPAAPAETDGLPSYAAVLDDTCDVAYNGADYDEEHPFASTGLIEMARYLTPQEMAESVGYLLEDISGDGVPELLIGTPSGEGSACAVLGGYTLRDGKPAAFLDGWGRNSYQYIGEGRFFNTGSSGAAYSMFGIFRISPDGTELVCEDMYFTWPRDTDYSDIAFYHNTTGVWDVAQAEELDIDSDAFWERLQSYADQTVELSFTPLGQYEYIGYVKQPLDCKVRVDYLSDVEYRLDGYDNASDYFAELYPEGREFETTVVFRSEEGVADFQLLSLSLRDVDDDGHARFDTTVVFNMLALRAGSPLAVPMDFPGDIPSNGFAYTDADGTVRRFSVSMSGKDGSLLVSPLD